MRIQIYIVIILTGLIYDANSQNWFAGSPSWEYNYNAWHCDFNIGSDVMRFLKDTTVHNIDMKLFEVEVHRNEMGTIYSYIGTKLYYEIDDVVYSFSHNKHQELYNFNHSIDYVDSIAWHRDESCDSLLYLRLDSIEQIEIGGNILRMQKWSKLEDSLVYPEYYIVIENIGAIDFFPFEARQHWNCHIHSCYPYSLNCYNNNDMQITYPSNSNCSVSVNEKIQDLNKPNVYPNPAENFINFDMANPISSVKIYDVTGELLKITHKAKNIDISNLKSGIYFLRALDYQGKLANMTFVKL